MNSRRMPSITAALVDDTGRLDISWTAREGRLNLVWEEIKSELIVPPANTGFGTKLVQQIGKQLLGEVKLVYKNRGAQVVLDIPLSLSP